MKTAVGQYADILGSDGLGVYRELVEKEWETIPELGPGEQDAGMERIHRRYRITRLMEELAEHEGDLEELVQVSRRDLSRPDDSMQIANLYYEADRHDEALAWAKHGRDAFQEAYKPRLLGFLAREYQRRGREEEMMDAAWSLFTERGDDEQYQVLETFASSIDAWPMWRDRAIDYVRGDAARQRENPTRWGRRPADRSMLVRLFLYAEGDVDAAWREAREGGCSDALWLALARRREEEHPEDALPIYQEQVEEQLGYTNKQAYAEAVEWLERVQALLERMGREEEFESFLDDVRTAHRQKRNFMKLLAAKGWG